MFLWRHTDTKRQAVSLCFGLIALGPLISEAVVAETREEAFHAVSSHLKKQIVVC